MNDNNLCNEVCNDFLPAFRMLAGTNLYSITLAGSHGKGIADKSSDFDFCLYYEKPAKMEDRRIAYKEIEQLIAKWKEKGVVVDGVWPRTYEEVEKQLDTWTSGNGEPESYMWTIWGYHFLTSIYNQQILEDTHGKVGQWKERLSTYPEALKDSIIKKHVNSLEYWRNDYHYRNKVQRKDVVFLASITTRLVHDMMQVIYALNKFYYPGDGMNLKYTEQFELKPVNFEERITDIFRISDAEDTYEVQYVKLTGLIDEVLELAR